MELLYKCVFLCASVTFTFSLHACGHGAEGSAGRGGGKKFAISLVAGKHLSAAPIGGRVGAKQSAGCSEVLAGYYQRRLVSPTES